MRIIIGFALGYIMARKIYIRYDRRRALEMERKAKERLRNFLHDNGLTKKESAKQAKEILGD